LAKFPAFFGVDQIGWIRQPSAPPGQAIDPHECPEPFGVTVHPTSSARINTTSTSFLGCLALRVIEAQVLVFVNSSCRRPSPEVERAHALHRSLADRYIPCRITACEHAFVSIKGSSNAYFRRTLETRRLAIVLPAAAELPWINLSDSLEILTLMTHEGDPRFDRAAAAGSVGASSSHRR
jgi:hypothetical protein